MIIERFTKFDLIKFRKTLWYKSGFQLVYIKTFLTSSYRLKNSKMSKNKRSGDDDSKLESDNDDYEPFVPIKKRKV